jgi:hypothetical protein
MLVVTCPQQTWLACLSNSWYIYIVELQDWQHTYTCAQVLPFRAGTGTRVVQPICKLQMVAMLCMLATSSQLFAMVGLI